jgi:hypothetical protein
MKYLIVGGIVGGIILLAYHLNKKSTPKIIPRKNEEGTIKNEKIE